MAVSGLSVAVAAGRASEAKFSKKDVTDEGMAIRVATEGDSGFNYDPESGYRGKNWEGYRP